MLAQRSPEEFLRSVDDAKAARRREKELERSVEHRVLEPWERYRALSDQYDALQDLAEQDDRKTRFALLILGSINAINLLIVTQGDVVGLHKQSDTVAAVYVTCYALLSLVLFVGAITALRPRREDGAKVLDASGDAPLALKTSGAVLRQSLAEYQDRWRQAQVGHLNTELATMVYQIAHHNALKQRALHRVYVGLYVLVALTGIMLAVVATVR